MQIFPPKVGWEQTLAQCYVMNHVRLYLQEEEEPIFFNAEGEEEANANSIQTNKSESDLDSAKLMSTEKESSRSYSINQYLEENVPPPAPPLPGQSSPVKSVKFADPKKNHEVTEKGDYQSRINTSNTDITSMRPSTPPPVRSNAIEQPSDTTEYKDFSTEDTRDLINQTMNQTQLSMNPPETDRIKTQEELDEEFARKLQKEMEMEDANYRAKIEASRSTLKRSDSLEVGVDNQGQENLNSTGDSIVNIEPLLNDSVNENPQNHQSTTISKNNNLPNNIPTPNSSKKSSPTAIPKKLQNQTNNNNKRTSSPSMNMLDSMIKSVQSRQICYISIVASLIRNDINEILENFNDLTKDIINTSENPQNPQLKNLVNRRKRSISELKHDLPDYENETYYHFKVKSWQFYDDKADEKEAKEGETNKGSDQTD